MSTTHLRAGEEVQFVVESLEAVHGFSIQGTNISTAVTQGDKPGGIEDLSVATLGFLIR